MQNKQETKPEKPVSICIICEQDKTAGTNEKETLIDEDGLIYGLKPELYKKYLRAYVKMLNEIAKPSTNAKDY